MVTSVNMGVNFCHDYYCCQVSTQLPLFVTDGFYIYTDGVPGQAYLVSPELTLSQLTTHCLSFWYFVYGTPVPATLHVFINEMQAYSRPEWSRSGSQSQHGEWRKGQIQLTGTAPVQVSDTSMANTITKVYNYQTYYNIFFIPKGKWLYCKKTKNRYKLNSEKSY